MISIVVNRVNLPVLLLKWLNLLCIPFMVTSFVVIMFYSVITKRLFCISDGRILGVLHF